MNHYVLALCGIPASGKTTLAKRLQEALNEDSEVALVSTDQWRDQAYYAEFTPEKENAVRELGISKTRDILNDGFSVIHDDTNYYASMRHELYILALEKECVFGIIYVSTPLEVSLDWNAQRDDPLPESVIHRIHERFDIPGSKYAWDKPLYSLNLARANLDINIGKILKRLKKAKPLRYRRKPIPGYSEFYDKLTRQIVSDFLKKEKKLRVNPEVSAVRKETLHIAIQENLSRDEVQIKLLEKLNKLKN